MATERQIEVSGISVEVVHNDIKNCTWPSTRRVRVAVPLRTSDENVRMAVVSRLGWIRRQQNSLEQQ